jgi:hypothetical protein
MQQVFSFLLTIYAAAVCFALRPSHPKTKTSADRQRERGYTKLSATVSISKHGLKMRLTAQLTVQHTHREVTRRLPSTKRRRLDEPDNRAMPATLANQHSSIVEIAQERGSARRCAGIAVLALVPFDERLHVDLEEDLLDGGRLWQLRAGSSGCG